MCIFRKGSFLSPVTLGDGIKGTVKRREIVAVISIDDGWALLLHSTLGLGWARKRGFRRVIDSVNVVQ